MPTVQVTAHECKAKQAEIFRRAAAGETIIVTRNGVPHVEIRKARHDDERTASAVHALSALHSVQVAASVGCSHEELRRIQREGREGRIG